jgi:hypothetical protein
MQATHGKIRIKKHVWYSKICLKQDVNQNINIFLSENVSLPRIQNENYCQITPNKPKLINANAWRKTWIYQKKVCLHTEILAFCSYNLDSYWVSWNLYKNEHTSHTREGTKAYRQNQCRVLFEFVIWNLHTRDMYTCTLCATKIKHLKYLKSETRKHVNVYLVSSFESFIISRYLFTCSFSLPLINYN